jgi:hypothetical protein
MPSNEQSSEILVIKKSSRPVQIVIIIEDYPEDKYSPSCLLLGLIAAHRVLHIQVSRLDSDSLKIITLYEPDTDKWINYKIRKE